ncbi:2-oxoglutarate and iron-dependent oxygenase domain-containing protein [Pararhodobacter zhoushanensis]|uniref:Non-haem dioxygenase N-terminal domain-containing protein n=1 Tax=Pararhodobacter zhoushanensis TaxID=2479545 RepID=A0ABT3GZN7_9RHOB|nr:2-oxoglutarate and iron-dependent oxygenase domain-containing protein [Pararhodobacter zhoushanensis]MCW1933003.1 hypothetical protein [Pararhodobacter zhoushanensis]
MTIPRVDWAALRAGDPVQVAEGRRGACDVGFLTRVNTPIDAGQLRAALAASRAFFAQPLALKAAVDMARTGASRGWGGPGSEQVDPAANRDYNEVFDLGFAVAGSALAVPAPTLGPERPEGYYARSAGAFAARVGRDSRGNW